MEECESATGTDFLSRVGGRTSQDTEYEARDRVSGTHELSSREGQMSTQKECEEARGTHSLSNIDRWTSQRREGKQAKKRH